MNLWSLAIGTEAYIATEVAGNLKEIEQHGIAAGARLKALSEVLCFYPSTTTGLHINRLCAKLEAVTVLSCFSGEEKETLIGSQEELHGQCLKSHQLTSIE